MRLKPPGSKLLGAIALLASGLLAQGAEGSLHMLLGFAGDNTNSANSVPVAGMYDLDRDGKVDPSGSELFAWMRKWFSTNNGNYAFIEDEQHIVENTDLSHYFADGGDGHILLARDANANGVIEDSEVVSWVKFGAGQSTFGPNTIGVAKAGSNVVVYTGLNSDSRASSRPTGIFRSEDKNANGNAKDTGETVLLLDKSSALTFPKNGGGNVTLKNDNWERVRVVPLFANIIAFNEGGPAATPAEDSFCYYGFQETNGKLSKHWVFFNPSKVNGLVRNPDIASGALEELDLQFTRNNQTQRFNGYRFCEVDQNGHLNRFPVYYLANTYGAQRSFGSKNSSNVALQGVVLRGIDLNRDGDLMDTKEVTVFFNGSGNDVKGGLDAQGKQITVKVTSWTETGRGTVKEIAGFVTGLAEGEGVVYVQVEDGRNDYVLELRDKNANGVIDPTGEVKELYRTPSSPFPKIFSSQFGPFSLELHAVDRSLIVDPMPAGAAPFGEGCVGSSGLRPRMSVAGGAPQVGNAKLQIELKRGEPSKGALLWFGISKTELIFMSGIKLPVALDGLGLTGCKQWVSIELLFATATNNAGGAFWPLPLPNDNALKGKKFYFQSWNQDPTANSGQWIVSNGLELTIQ